MPLLECVNIQKSFVLNGEPLHVVDGVSFSVDPGEIVVLLGKSGCGKSTLLRILGGLISPDDGEVVVDGNPLHGPTPKVSMVFQNYGVFPWMNVLKNVKAGLHHRELDRQERERIAWQYLKLVGLWDFAKVRPGTLSGGMQQRVALARTYAMDPEVLLMDEPFGALDAFTRREMQEELLRINSEKQKAVVFVTHDIDEATLLASRILVLSFRPAKTVGDFARGDYGSRVLLREAVASRVDSVFGLVTNKKG